MKGLAYTSKPYFFSWPLFFFIVSAYILDLQTFCNEILKFHFDKHIESSSLYLKLLPLWNSVAREGEPSLEKDRIITWKLARDQGSQSSTMLYS